MSIILATGRLRYEDFSQFKVSMAYMVRPCLKKNKVYYFSGPFQNAIKCHTQKVSRKLLK